MHVTEEAGEKRIEIRKRASEAIGQGIELHKVTAGIKNKFWIIALSSIACMAAGFLGFLVGPKEYQAESLLFYELKVPPTLANHYAVNHLSSTTAVELTQLPSNFKAVRTILGLDIPEAEIQKMVTLQAPQKGSSFLRITTTAPSPEMAVNITNALAKVAAKRALEFNQTQLKEAYGYFVRELDLKRKALDDATLELAQFRIQHKYQGADQNSVPIFEKIEQLETKLSDAQLEYNGLAVQYENIMRQMEEQPEQVARYDYESSPLKIRLNRAEMSLLDAKTRYADDNPKIKLLEKEISDLKKMIAEESKQQDGYKIYEANPAKAKYKAALLALQNRLRVSQRLREDLQEALDKQKAELSGLPQVHAQFSKLMYNRSLVQASIQTMEDAIKTIETLMASGTSDLNIYQLSDRAEKTINFMLLAIPFIGLFAGAGISLSLVALSEIVDRKIRTRTQLESRYTPPCLLVMPEIKKLDAIIKEQGIEKSPLNSYVNRLWDRIRYFLKGYPSSLAFTSATTGEGKSTLVQHLAAVNAKRGLPTLTIQLVPLAEAPVGENVFTLTDFMYLNTAELLNRAQNNIANVIVTYNEDAQHLLDTPECAYAFSTRDAFSLVLIDCPGLLEGDHVERFAQLANQVIVVVGSNVATTELVDAAVLHCELYGINPLGMVLTQTNNAYVDKISI